MKYKCFGRTGWNISALSLGSVEFGVEYGLYSGGEKRLPNATESVNVILHAFEQGINLIDTAPNYGDSEMIVGRALRAWSGEVFVATKVTLAADDVSIYQSTVRSVDRSLKRLGRDSIDLLQIHNATLDDLQSEALTTTFSALRAQGKVRWFGATVYGVDTAHAAIKNNNIAVLQIAFNLLDQRMKGALFHAARDRGVVLLGRSALLKGALTERYHHLPATLEGLRKGVARVEQQAKKENDQLSSYALHYCLSQPLLSSVLIGVRTKAELDAALEVASRSPISPQTLDAIQPLALQDEQLIDPRNWELP